MANYIEIDYDEIKGYESLENEEKELFRRVYIKHNSVLGLDYKEEYLPISVESLGDSLKVRFRNKESLHYNKDDTWN